MVFSKRRIPKSLSSPNASASHYSHNKQIHLFLSPDRPYRDSKSGMRVKNIDGYKLQDMEKQVPQGQITPKMLDDFRRGWHDRALSSSNWRVRVNT